MITNDQFENGREDNSDHSLQYVSHYDHHTFTIFQKKSKHAKKICRIMQKMLFSVPSNYDVRKPNWQTALPRLPTS